MNLLTACWLPFRTRDGTTTYRAPSAVADPEVIDLALHRADFQGAAHQFLIGLLQTALPPQDHGEWLDRFIEPPSIAELERVFAPFNTAFELDGERARFMQDLDPLKDVKETTVSGLLIDSPGANGVKNNTDFFVKRGRVDAMCEDCSALALFTMQINAPAGGAGIRVGLRGGGPLTTLVLPELPDASLWSRLWLNVLTPKALTRSGQTWKAPRADDDTLFLWMAPTRVSDKKGTEVLPDGMHPLHPYWSMPRRFRLLFEDASCRCDICGRETTRAVRQIRAKKQGTNYDGPWLHPLTPYRRDPKKPSEPPLSTKGQPGGLGYQHWSNLVLHDADTSGALPALVVQDYIAGKVPVVDEERRFGEEIVALLKHARLWAFGHDMDNMKPRGWYSVEMPLVAVPPAQQERLRSWVQQYTELARQVAWMVRTQVKNAWFARPSDAKGDMSHIDLQFYDATQGAFFHALHAFKQALTEVDDTPRLPSRVAEAWYLTLKHEALALFEEQALSGALEAVDLQRATAARRQLLSFLAGRSKGSKAIRQFAETGGFVLSAKPATTEESVS
ncbi:type I-E CRISPR-associated protein Cse1/CasA [Ectothiorhodospira variabilis]|uniref:type I-E CRISPR-associated protein Cse1/CasA n=1 Tax=Ectothiorhodospira variabilis TaxID=505694 RepID=UPI001EFAB0D8|nr:type I-E CRISPR-associated protein Cse1/CasA [Ectothiorhodospira variabilis]MCG5494361.1 type I-E CRISPR-associated protein Cse1/CasA [Ectothiorhodospira variabilis]MCG5504128.1 type I-E CRISPR-associated protein Cse1/CasA [Ectothiorhodospira variabilis]MCG5507283.1 type I-E CRISPR-associated protein Cse1/CasA [Ectothiorhodospira variabilis]